MDVPTLVLVLALIVLIVMSAYFSSSETAMMKLNPYQLKHQVNQGHQAARRAAKLLGRQDRLLGVILVGNNLVNNSAAIIASAICFRWFGNAGYAIAAFGLTLIMLVFAEVGPKTVAAERPESIAFPSSYILTPLQRIFSPVVALVNFCSNAMVNPLIRSVKARSSSLSLDELRTVVGTESDIPQTRQSMLLGILDLGKAKVEDIMIRSAEVDGIDLSRSERETIEYLLHAPHTLLPVYRDELDNVVGVLHLKHSGDLLHPETFDIESLKKRMEAPYFVPEGTPLSAQLIHFQRNKSRFAFVVNEYGTVEGILTLQDILEEIVGDFTTKIAENISEIYPQEDGSYVIHGTAQLRDINTELDWSLPTTVSRTLNGLILEHLEDIPGGNVCVRIDDYLFETIRVDENSIRSIKVVFEPKVVDEEEEAD